MPIPMRCKHPSREVLVEYEGLVVEQCLDCHDILPLDKSNASDSIYDHTETHLSRAVAEADKYFSAIDEYLRQYAPVHRYELWREISLKIPWWFSVQKGKYLILRFRDVSKQRVGVEKEKRSEHNIETSRSFGRIDDYPGIDTFFYYCDMYFAWSKIVRFLEDIRRAIEGGVDERREI